VFAIAIAIAGWLSAPCDAHELSTATARITLRDGHLEVLADVDLFLLADRGPTEVATASEPDLAALLARIRDVVVHQTRLVVDGSDLALALRGLPSAAELRAIAAALSASHRDHGELVRLRLEARAARPVPQSIALSLPPGFGPVIVSLVQPTTRYVAAGAPAWFDVPALARSSPASLPWGWLGLAALSLAGFVVAIRRRSAAVTALALRAPPLILAILAVGACTTADTTTDAGEMIVTSTAFVDGGALPADLKCTRDGGTGASPPIAWNRVPSGTASIAISMIHYPVGTTPGKDTPNHYWLLWNIDPSVTQLAQGNPESIGVEGSNKDGVGTGYTPPCSPAGSGTHTYTLRVHALSGSPTALGSSDSVAVTYDAFMAGIEPLVLGTGQLSFTN
jgi:phosphatidylethanolamine-binding protein (PEBP) family uncharacterized protein